MSELTLKASIEAAITTKNAKKLKILLEDNHFHHELTEESEEGYFDDSIMPHMVLHDLFELAVEHCTGDSKSKKSAEAVADLIKVQLDEYIEMELDYYSYTLLHHYAYMQNEKILRYLIKKGYSINAGFYEETNGLTFSGSILTEAIRQDPENPIVSFIVYHPQFTNMQEGGYQRNSDSAYEGLSYASKIYPLESLFDTVYRDTLHKKGATLIDLRSDFEGVYYRGSLLAQALLAYKKQGDIDLRRVETLLFYGADASSYIDNEISPLAYVTFECSPTEQFTLDKQIRLIRLLMGYGASLIENRDNYYDRLIWNGDEDIARLLLGLNEKDTFLIDVPEEDLVYARQSPKANLLNGMMETAINERNAQVVGFLLQQGVDPTARCVIERHMSFIHKAIEVGDFECFKALLDSGNIDVNGKYESSGLKVTPIIIAARTGRIDMMEYLIKLGAKLQPEMYPMDDNDLLDLEEIYVSPLVTAIMFKHFGAARYLLNAGININQCLYDLALYGGQTQVGLDGIVSWLVENGASLRADTEEFSSPVECALECENLSVFEALLNTSNRHTFENGYLEHLIKCLDRLNKDDAVRGEMYYLLQKTLQRYEWEWRESQRLEAAMSV